MTRLDESTLCALALHVLAACCVLVCAGCQIVPKAASTTPIMVFTDAGADSAAVGAIKGAIYTHNPAARIDVLSNSAPAFNVTASAFMLAAAVETFPPETVFMCMVSPDTHAHQSIIALETDNGLRFVAPNNGLLTAVADKFGVKNIRECTNLDVVRHENRSHVNLGREVLAPIAAAWASGTPIESFGSPIHNIERVDVPVCEVRDGAIHGAVLWVDEYGNAMTNVSLQKLIDEKLSTDHGLAVFLLPNVLNRLVVGKTYSDVEVGAPVAIFHPFGFMELAINQGNFAETYGIEPGRRLRLGPAYAISR